MDALVLREHITRWLAIVLDSPHAVTCWGERKCVACGGTADQLEHDVNSSFFRHPYRSVEPCNCAKGRLIDDMKNVINDNA